MKIQQQHSLKNWPTEGDWGGGRLRLIMTGEWADDIVNATLVHDLINRSIYPNRLSEHVEP